MTLTIKLVAALILGLHRPRRHAVVAHVNIITNPVLTVIMVLLSFTALEHSSLRLLLIFETIIVLIEGRLYRGALPKIRHPHLLSLSANSASALLGMLK
ncbi:MAG: hypothetical protein SOS98_01530 [Varibaculum sp.]|nr:hypothetical protein [Varibaculum sp.]